MTELSPVAQAVLDAFSNASDGEYVEGVWVVNERTMLAAALRAAADQVVPYEEAPKGMSKSVMEYSNREYRRAQRQATRAAILAIAAELDGGALSQPQPPADGEVGDVLQWPEGWSRRKRAQEAEALCRHAGISVNQVRQLVRDARDGLPLQDLHDLIGHATSEPQPPADGEVGELVAWLRLQGEAQKPRSNSLLSKSTKNEQYGFYLKLTRAADLLERRYPQPIPVAERLPKAGDCTGDGCCWVWNFTAYTWGVFRLDPSAHTHWLPFNALPLPSDA